MTKVTCPHCRHVKLVSREPVAYRVCQNCKKKFTEPPKKKKR